MQFSADCADRGGSSVALTPVEIRHIKLSRSLFGYTRSAVDELLDDIVESFEQVWRERADLADKIERVDEDLVRYRELETLLRTTLVSAERASQDLKEQARRETQVMLDEAHAEARRIRREASADLERMRSESRRIRSLLGAALATLEDDNGADESEARAA
jgi:cell division initiation protein